MALGFGSAQRLERLLLKTRNILGEGVDSFRDDNKAQALQTAASIYGLYGGNGSETTYTDSASITILQAELIATTAAIDLISSAISYYKDQVVTASGGPASASFRSDKLAWLKEQSTMLEDKKKTLEEANGYSGTNDIPGLLLAKVRACTDPVEDVCCDTEALESLSVTVGVTP
jgi:hypothetical protein